MDLTSRFIEIVNDLDKEILRLSDEIDTIGSLTALQHAELINNLISCRNALVDAKKSFLKDKENSYYLMPFTVATLLCGEIFGHVKYGKYISKLKSEYNAIKQQKDPRQLAKKEIEKDYDSVKSQFKRRGYSAIFIREMHQKYPEITDIKTIERLVTKLNKSNELIPPRPAKRGLN